MSAQRSPTWGLKQHAHEVLPQWQHYKYPTVQNRAGFCAYWENQCYLCHKKVVRGHYSNCNLDKFTVTCGFPQLLMRIFFGDIHQRRIKFKLLNWYWLSSPTLLLTYFHHLPSTTPHSHQMSLVTVAQTNFTLSHQYVFVQSPRIPLWPVIPPPSSLAMPKLNTVYLNTTYPLGGTINSGSPWESFRKSRVVSVYWYDCCQFIFCFVAFKMFLD